ncbi:hypothetical protein Cni_G25360 [Canna indica]|uniref:Uncharacterized protein n=1 Tax=Canna indica TaxID=4628 RepID=A0AAQ3QP63_9LILI|nr:hypothetical protein Cni_G25360 [Canna indica]
MRHLSNLGIGFSLVSGCLFLALVAELCYLVLWKKRTDRAAEANYRSLSDLFCWKGKSSSALNPNDISITSMEDQLQRKDLLLKPLGRGEEESLEAELMRLHGLAGPPRFLFTIKEETWEDLELEEGWSRDGRSGKGSRGKSLSDLFLSSSDTPPLLVPPLIPLDRCDHGGFSNPLFEACGEEDLIPMWPSPPPKFKFLKDAEEKLYRKKKMTEEVASQVQTETGDDAPKSEKDGSLIAIVIGKNRERGHSSSSQVNPLPSSYPSRVKPLHKKIIIP